MAKRTCSIEGCDSTVRSRGWCSAHYQRWGKYGDPEFRPPERAGSRGWPAFPENLLTKMRPQPNGCVHYGGYIDPNGYGRLGIDGVSAYAHRAAYELFVGPIPDGMTIDHECHNRDRSCVGGVACLHRRCVNVVHLRACTPEENTRAGWERRRPALPALDRGGRAV